jgi:hypothetical protein
MGMILAPASVPVVFHAMFTTPNSAIGNSMACRVYRDIKFGHINATTQTSQRSVSVPQFNHQVRHPKYGVSTKTEYSGDNTVGPEYGVHISTTVERTLDIPMVIISGKKEDSRDKSSISIA